ncbi:hypothetical protein [Bradyrhizobium sp.]|nr:hypothetical protein [Bradyrhizobium sp.]
MDHSSTGRVVTDVPSPSGISTPAAPMRSTIALRRAGLAEMLI